MARFRGVLELLVVALAADANPTVGLESLDHLGTPRVVYQYTIRRATSSRLHRSMDRPLSVRVAPIPTYSPGTYSRARVAVDSRLR